MLQLRAGGGNYLVNLQSTATAPSPTDFKTRKHFTLSLQAHWSFFSTFLRLNSIFETQIWFISFLVLFENLICSNTLPAFVIMKNRIKDSKPFFFLLPEVPETGDKSVSYKWDPRESIQ
jgi:hypothetical protein